MLKYATATESVSAEVMSDLNCPSVYMYFVFSQQNAQKRTNYTDEFAQHCVIKMDDLTEFTAAVN